MEGANMRKRISRKYWVTGIMLWGYPTKAKTGVIAGFDADFGEMYALNGVLVPEFEYNRIMK